MVIYSARRVRLSRIAHESSQALKVKAQIAKISPVKITGSNRPSDWRIEDDLIISLSLRLDAFADDMASQVHNVKQVDLLFDEIDIAKRYETQIQRTREVSNSVTTVAGWDPVQGMPVEGAIEFQVDAPFRIDTKFVGKIQVMGKEHPLVLATDVVTNYLAHHLKKLPPDAPVNSPRSVTGWVLEEQVWGVSDNAMDDIL